MDNLHHPGKPGLLHYLLIGVLMLTIITGNTMCGKKGGGGSGSSGVPVVTAPATQVTATSAVLNGTVIPNGLATNASFQWGLTTSYGNSTTAQSIGSGTVSVAVSATLIGLTPNTLYNFRVVSTDAEGPTYGGNRTFTTLVTPPAKVSSPIPANGAGNVPVSQQLSWGAVSGATYDVYFGTTSPGTLIGNQSGTTYNPGALLNNTLYYWRIDSTNAVSGTTTGNVWSFTTIVLPPAQVGSPSPGIGAINVPVNQQLSWGAASGATSYNVYFGTTSPGASMGSQSGTTYNPGVLSISTVYYWRIDSVNAGGTTTGIVWSFTTTSIPPPAQVGSPSPANGATNIPTNQQLSWGAVTGATYDVYFGTTSPGNPQELK